MNKPNSPLLFLVAALVVLASCGTSQKVTSSWVDPHYQKGQRKYHKIFIAAVVNNKSVRTSLENDLANAARSRGYEVVTSLEVYGPSFTKDNTPSREEMIGKIRTVGCDLIFTVTLVDKLSESRYVPGTNSYSPWSAYGYGFRGYYNYWSPYMSDPGYYTTDKAYFMEGALFDAASENMIWSVQTEAYNPSSIESFSKSLTELMVRQVQKDLGVAK
jgi:hypothetical protein